MTVAAYLLDPDEGYGRTMKWLRDHVDIDSAAEQAAQRLNERTGEPLPLVLNRLGAVNDADLQAAFEAASGIPRGPAYERAIAIEGVSPTFLRARRAVVLSANSDTVTLGVIDPFDFDVASGVAFALDRSVELVILRADDLRQKFSQAYEAGDNRWSIDVADRDAQRIEAALEFDRDAPVARRVASWITDAVERRASDIHLEPRSHAFVIRYRIDGALATVVEEPLAAAAPVITRIKVLADLDLGERRNSQDGRATVVIGGRPVDLRISIVPSVHGESAVIRILDRSEVRLEWDRLGFSPIHCDLLKQACALPHGLFLVTGPTGSGKTTTLYACLQSMQDQGRKILTIEDPVEFYFDHVTQVQLAPKAGVTFPSAIRAFLRQDPDVIMVGEIRDSDTAKIAIQAALTGHLVLATLHAIDVTRAPVRLMDMGVEKFQLAACLRGVLAQRLVRRVCPDCAAVRPATEIEASILGLRPGEPVPDATGCADCNYAGFHGRLAIAEGQTLSEDALLSGSNAYPDADTGAPPPGLVADGVTKIRAGLTSPGEVMRALLG